MSFFVRSTRRGKEESFGSKAKKATSGALLACISLALMALLQGCAGVVSGSNQTAPPTYTISGAISPSAGGSGATVTLGGAASQTATASSSGSFTFTGLTNGSYTVKSSKTGYTFSPTMMNTTVSGADVTGINFTATAQTNPTYTLSGTISPTAGGSGATVTLSGAASATTTANSSGAYTFTSLANGSYTVTPSKTGYTFAPTSLNATVNGANVTGINFTDTAQATPTYTLSGTISPTAGGSGATVRLSGAASATATANSSGAYTFTGLANGSYTVTPSKTGYTFAPTSLNATVNGANVTGINFTDTAQTTPTYALSGTISPTAGGSGATVTLSGAASATTTANSSGAYTFTGLANGSYAVTPSHTGYTFAPTSQNATVSGANVTGINFTATAQTTPTYTLSGTLSPTAGGSGATVRLSGAASATTTANSSGAYTFTGLANGSYTVTPSNTGYTFAPTSLNATVNGANVTGINFTDTAQSTPTYTVSGTISPVLGGSGATLTLSGAASATTTANSSGSYTFTGLANGSYTVTPSNSGYTFTPGNQAVSVSGANVTGVDFDAQVAVPPVVGAPALFFTDLISGPATGNSDPTYSSNGGVYVTLYGNFFGLALTSSNVSLNGSNCLGIVSQPTTWLWYQKFTVQLHSGCTTGNFTVTTASGTSNGLPFTVQSENIYFASGSGNDSSGSGSWTAPWKTLTHARSTMSAGSVVYAETGSDATANDGSGWSTSMLINQNGTVSAPYAMVVYPGESVTIGAASGISSAIRSGDSMPTNYWTFAGFHLVAGEVNSQWGSNYWRWIGNDITCPNGNGEEGCFEPIESTFIYTYGNNFHNMGVTGASAEYHGVYLATDSSEQDFGWNEIGFSNGGRGLQTHSEYNGPGTNGYGIWNISIHDNIIHDTGSDCIVGDTLSPNGVGTAAPEGGPTSGPVTIYNNIFYNCGLTTPPEDTGDWSGIELPGTTTDGPAPSGTIYIFNNTFYAFGLNTNPPYGSSEYGVTFGGSNSLLASASNNLLYSTRGSSVPYFGGGSAFTGTNNWMYGGPSTSGASGVTGTIGTSPSLTNVTSYNFVPLVGSPIIGAGKSITGVVPFGFNNIGRDISGNPRPSTPSIGAYE